MFFCFGIGYIGLKWLNDLSPLTEKAGTTTSLPKLQNLNFSSIKTYLFKNARNFEIDLGTTTHLLITIPPSHSQDEVLQFYKKEIIENKGIKWIGVLSSTGVYGDHQGEWVGENSKCSPTSLQSQNRLRCEHQWLELHAKHNLPIHIFRLAGIYGPERTLIPSILEGKASRINKPDHKFSRIHSEDIIQVLKASMTNPKGGSLYNLADDFPASTKEIIEFICLKLNLPLPPLVEYDKASLSPQLKQFYQDNKRVANEKIKTELNIKLKYPSYKEGLQSGLEKYASLLP